MNWEKSDKHNKALVSESHQRQNTRWAFLCRSKKSFLIFRFSLFIYSYPLLTSPLAVQYFTTHLFFCWQKRLSSPFAASSESPPGGAQGPMTCKAASELRYWHFSIDLPQLPIRDLKCMDFFIRPAGLASVPPHSVTKAAVAALLRMNKIPTNLFLIPLLPTFFWIGMTRVKAHPMVASTWCVFKVLLTKPTVTD